MIQDIFYIIKKILRKKKKQVSIVVIVVLIITGGLGYYLMNRSTPAGTDTEAQKELAEILGTLRTFIELPTDEDPTVATVLDKDKLNSQPFFKNAENGDKLLAYTKSMKAILYRPSTKKIIEVAPIVIQQPTTENTQASAQTSNSSATSSTALKVSYYNGTTVVGLATQAEKTVRTAHPTYQTGKVTTATRRDYKQTIVIDVSGNHAAETESIARLLGGVVGSLPQGEIKPEADILVISGK